MAPHRGRGSSRGGRGRGSSGGTPTNTEITDGLNEMMQTQQQQHNNNNNNNESPEDESAATAPPIETTNNDTANNNSTTAEHQLLLNNAPTIPNNNNNNNNGTAEAAAPAYAYDPTAGGIDEEGWSWPSDKPRYLAHIISCMSFFHGKNYTKRDQFTKEQLLELTPKAVHDWMAIKAFGKVRYNVNQGDRSTGARWNNLDFMKKAVSYYMPYQRKKWADGQGNPTTSDIVNKLMGIVRKLEARGLGAKSCVKRPLSQPEFLKEQELMRKQTDWEHRFKYPTMNIYQYSLVGRADDTCHFQVGDLKGHATFGFALQTKVRWSKNVIDERKCPDQIFLGANDPLWCVFIHIAVYLESYLRKHPNAKYLFTEKINDPNPAKDTAPNNLKGTWRRRSNTVAWKAPEFKAIEPEGAAEEGGIGTHSRRKFSADYASNCGCDDKEIEIRGRWKNSRGRIVFIYIGVKKLYEDAKVCSKLCVGGPVMYVLKPGLGSTITQQWMFDNVIPNIRRRYSNDTKLCRVLGTALLYACISDDPNIYIPRNIRSRVRSAYNSLGLDESQPVMKVPLIVYRDQDQLRIEPIADPGQGVAAGNSNNNGEGAAIINGTTAAATATYGTTPAANAQAIQLMSIRQTRLENQLGQVHVSLQASIGESRSHADHQFRMLNNNIRAFGSRIQGAFSIQQQQQQAPLTNENERRLLALNGNPSNPLPEIVQPANLCDRPSSLVMLWEEYINGIDGNKPAEQFSRAEVNVNKAMAVRYGRRNTFWKTMKRLVDQGHSHQVAINRIRNAYGWHSSVTQILKKMNADKKNGGHPNLR